MTDQPGLCSRCGAHPATDACPVPPCMECGTATETIRCDCPEGTYSCRVCRIHFEATP